MCVYAHAHTLCIHIGVLGCEPLPGVGMRHLEGPKNPDGLNLDIHLFVYVYKVHMRMFIVGGGTPASYKINLDGDRKLACLRCPAEM